MSVVVVGSINQDIICRVAVLPRPGETVAARRTLVLQGGKGANQAIAAARLGATVTMIGCVGDDAAGTSLIDALRSCALDVRDVVRLPGMRTGTAYIAIDDDAENQIIVDPGANAGLTDGMIRADALSAARVVLAQLETPVAATARAFALAGAAGGYRILNTAPALAEAARIFPRADMLILNQSELARLLGLDAEPTTPDDALVARRLLGREGQCAVVTLGAAGAVLVEHAEMHVAPGFRVPAIDTTGAGDCFCGALAAMLAEGMPAAQALPIANAAAALCVQGEGAGPAMPTRAAVDALLAGGGIQ